MSLDALKASPEVWSFCAQAFRASGEDRVKFWCLQAMVDAVREPGRWEAADEARRSSLRSSLTEWVASKGGPATDEQAYVKNKFAQLVVALVRADYPERWPDVFLSLLGALGRGEVAVDIFLRVLSAVHEEVVTSEVPTFNPSVAARVKDGMREQCIGQIVEAWYTILSEFAERNPPLVALCLEVVRHYAVWVDIGLVASPRFLELFLAFVQREALHEGACACLTAVVVKRMDPAVKLEHLGSLRVVELLAAANEAMCASGMELSEAFADLAAAISLELLDCWDRLSARGADAGAESAAALLRGSMPLLLRALAAESLEVSQCTTTFLHAYLGRLRKLQLTAEQLALHEDQLQLLLVHLARRCVCPDDFSSFESMSGGGGAAAGVGPWTKEGSGGGDPDDEDASFVEYRREMGTLFRSVARVHPALACDFVQSTLRSMLDSLKTSRWAHVEVALWLMYQLGEGLSDGAVREKGGLFEQMMLSLLASPAASHPHQAVGMIYFEILVRYYRFFLQQPAALPDALRTFLDGRGIRSRHAALRRRACVLLLRFVKQTLKAPTMALLEAAAQILDVLRSQPSGARAARGAGVAGGSVGRGAGGSAAETPRLGEAEQLCLYEACGLLLGCGIASEEASSAVLDELLALPMNELQLLDELGATSSDAELMEARAADVAHRVSVIAAVSKGYQSLTSPVARGAFTRAMQLTLAALGPYGASAEVRGRSVTLLHRMVETFSIDVLSYLTPALPHLLHPADPKETADVTALLVQMILKFKSAIAHSVSPVVGPVTAAIFSQVDKLEKAMAAEARGGSVRTPLSEEGRERRALLRAYFSFLHAIVTNDLTPVLSDGNNFPLLLRALTRLLQGCVEGPDLTVQRQCFLIVQRIVEHLAGKDDSFDDYVRASILPASFTALAQPHFNLRDAAALALLEAVAGIQMAMLTKLGPAFLSHLHDVYLPSISVSAEFNDEYARLLTLGDPRQLRDFLRQRLDLASAES